MNILLALPSFLAQTADYTVNNGMSHQVSPVTLVVYLALVLLMIAALWKIFTKAGEPGWASIIPFYNAYILCKVAGKPGWWLILFLIPFVNLIIGIIVNLGLARNFGKGGGFTVGLIFLPFIFLPILAFGSARYLGGPGTGTLSGGTTSYPTV